MPEAADAPEANVVVVEYHIDARLFNIIGLFASAGSDYDVEWLGHFLAMAEGRFAD